MKVRHREAGVSGKIVSAEGDYFKIFAFISLHFFQSNHFL